MRKGKRLIAVVLALTVALGSVCWKPPEAKAVVIDATAAFGAAAATAAINGTTATTLFTGMSTSAATTAMTTLMGEYAAATGAAASGTAFAGTIGAGTIVTAAGALVLTAAAGYAVYKFIEWLREEKGLEAGGQSVSVIADSVWFSGDVRFTLYSSDWELLSYGDFFSNDSTVDIDGHVVSCSLVERDGYYFCRYVIDGVSSETYMSQPFISWGFFYNPANSIRTGFCLQLAEDKYTTLYGSSTNVFWAGLTQVDCDLSLQSKAEFTPIPESIPETDAVVITGIDNLPQDDPQAIADTIMQTAIDGALAPVVTVEADPTVDTDPDAGTETDPDTGIDSDTNTSILDWLKQIWESICNIPSAIAEAIASIFVPSPDFYSTAISNLKDAFSDRMGLLTYPISVLFDFLDRVVNLSEQQPILTWGNIYLPGYATPLVAAGQYNLNDAIGTSQGKQLHDIYLVIVDAIMVLAFVDLCRHKYQKIIHN